MKTPTDTPPARRAWLIVALLAATMIAGCTSFGLVYPRLDWVLAWRMDKFVSLNAEQKMARAQEIARVLQWHRSEELPIYARDLRQIAAGIEHPVGVQQVEHQFARAEQLWRRVAVQSAPGFCRVMRTLDAPQAQELLDSIDKENRKFVEKFVEPSPEQRRRDAEKQMTKSISRWTGSLNDTQKAAIRDWSEHREELSGEWLVQRQQWRGRLAAALQQRASASPCVAFEPLLAWPTESIDPALRRRVDANDARRYHMIAVVIAAMDVSQREHARKELLNLADEMERLAKTAA